MKKNNATNVTSLHTLKKACKEAEIPCLLNAKKKTEKYTTITGISLPKIVHDRFLTRTIVDHFITYSKAKKCYTVKNTRELYRAHPDVQVVLKCLKKLNVLSFYSSKEDISPLIFKLVSEIDTYRNDDDVEPLLTVDFIKYEDRKALKNKEFLKEFAYTPVPVKNKKTSK